MFSRKKVVFIVATMLLAISCGSILANTNKPDDYRMLLNDVTELNVDLHTNAELPSFRERYIDKYFDNSTKEYNVYESDEQVYQYDDTGNIVTILNKFNGKVPYGEVPNNLDVEVVVKDLIDILQLDMSNYEISEEDLNHIAYQEKLVVASEISSTGIRTGDMVYFKVLSDNHISCVGVKYGNKELAENPVYNIKESDADGLIYDRIQELGFSVDRETIEKELTVFDKKLCWSVLVEGVKKDDETYNYMAMMDADTGLIIYDDYAYIPTDVQ